jgi:hypothetical protein
MRLRRREPVDAAVIHGGIAKDEAVSTESALDRGDGPPHPLVMRRQESDQRKEQRRRVDVEACIGLGEGLFG